MGIDINICSLLKGRLSTFYFVDWIDNYIGCGGCPSIGCHCLWTGKILSHIFKDVGGDKKHLEFVEKQKWKERKGRRRKRKGKKHSTES